MVKQMKTILDVLCTYYNVTPEYIFNKSREGNRVRVRQIFVAMVRELDIKVSLVEMSVFMHSYGGTFFDHATNINSLKKVKDRLDIYPAFYKEFHMLKEIIKSHNFPKIVVSEVNLLAMCASTF